MRPLTEVGPIDRNMEDDPVQNFFDKIPKILKEKHHELIQNIQEFIANDEEALKKFIKIINNKHTLFGEKLETLANLQEEF